MVKFELMELAELKIMKEEKLAELLLEEKLN